MAEILIIPATEEDVKYIAENMRKRDISEMLAAGDANPVKDVVKHFKLSVNSLVKVATYNGVPAVVFGVHRYQYTGIGWAVGTNNAIKCIPTVTRYINTEMKQAVIQAGIYHIVIAVLANYYQSRKWIEKLGAKHVRTQGKFAHYRWDRFQEESPVGELANTGTRH